MNSKAGGAGSECRIVSVESRHTAVVKVTAPFAKLPKMQRAARVKIAAALASADADQSGPGCTLWRPPVDGKLDMEPGVLVPRPFAPMGEVVPSLLPAGRTAHLLLTGPFEGLQGAWGTLLGWCREKELKLAGVNWEIYGEHQADSSRQETLLHALLL